MGRVPAPSEAARASKIGEKRRRPAGISGTIPPFVFFGKLYEVEAYSDRAMFNSQGLILGKEKHSGRAAVRDAIADAHQGGPVPHPPVRMFNGPQLN